MAETPDGHYTTMKASLLSDWKSGHCPQAFGVTWYNRIWAKPPLYQTSIRMSADNKTVSAAIQSSLELSHLFPRVHTHINFYLGITANMTLKPPLILPTELIFKIILETIDTPAAFIFDVLIGKLPHSPLLPRSSHISFWPIVSPPPPA